MVDAKSAMVVNKMAKKECYVLGDKEICQTCKCVRNKCTCQLEINNK